MIDVVIIFFIIVFYIFYRLTNSDKVYHYVLLFLVIQYLMINSNTFNKNNPDKLDLLNLIDQKYKPKTELFDKNKKYEYPFILKPSDCSSCSRGVELIKDHSELSKYIKSYGNDKLIYQTFIDTPHEYTILYEKNPFSKKGNIKNIYKTIYGNEIFKSENSTIDLTKSIKRNDLITPQLEKTIDSISSKIKGFYLGRYDIRVNSIEDLQNGNIYILELNGSMGFNNDTYTFNLLKRYIIGILFILKRIIYGLLNILKIDCLNPLIVFTRMCISFKCNDWNRLFMNNR